MYLFVSIIKSFCSHVGQKVIFLLHLQDLSILPKDNTYICAASLLMSYYSFWPLMLSLNVIIGFYILSKILQLKCKGLSDARVVPLTEKKYGFAVHFFVNIHDVSID